MSHLSHTFGLKGHVTIPPSLQAMADACGLRVTAKAGKFEIEGAGLDAVCPDFIERDGSTIDLPNLKKFLQFLHQPVRAGLQALTKTDAPEMRRDVHRLLRFMTTGSLRIEADTYHGLDRKSFEDHAGTETSMRDDDAWEREREFGNSRKVQSAVPGTRIDAGGFTLSLTPQMAGLQDFSGDVQGRLGRAVADMMQESTGQPQLSGVTAVHLSARQLANFIEAAHTQLEQGSLKTLMGRASFEADVQSRLSSIDQRVYDLARSPVYHRLSQQQSEDGICRLHSLLKATSALTPVVTSEELQQVWKRYQFSARKEGALEDLNRQYEILQATLGLYAKRPQVSSLQVEAIAQEFYPLLAFSAELSDLVARRAALSRAEDLCDTLQQTSQAFQDASVAGVTPMQAYMSHNQQKIISALERHLHLGPSGLAQLADAGVQSGKEFLGDLVQFAKETPYAIPVVMGLAATLYATRTGSQLPVDTTHTQILTFDGLADPTVTNVLTDSIPEELRKTQNWHWDMGPLGLYKHFMFDNIVVGVSEKLIDWTRMGTYLVFDQAGLPLNVGNGFFQTAADSIKPVSDRLFGLNVMQDLTHAGFWTYVGIKGYQHGLKGAHKIIDFLSPLTDLGYQAAMGVRDKLTPGSKAKILSQRLLGLAQGVTSEPCIAEAHPEIEDMHCQQHYCTLLNMARAAEVRTAVEDALPEAVREASIDLKIGGLKHQFQISAQNLAPILTALDQFDLVMEHIASQADIAEPWYQKILTHKISQVSQALKEFQQSGDEARLKTVLDEHLQDVLGAQVKCTDSMSLYKTMFGWDPDKSVTKIRARLSYEANASHGAWGRAAHQDERRAKLEDQSLSWIERTKTRAALLGSAVWGGMAGAARQAGRGLNTAATEPVVIAAAGLTAAAVALDVAGQGYPISNAVSAGAGAVTAGSVTTSTFLVWNLWQDVLQNHIGGAAVTLSIGAATGYAHKRLIRPVVMAGTELIAEKTGVDLRDAWHQAMMKLKLSKEQRVETAAVVPSTPMARVYKIHAVPFASDDDGEDLCDSCPVHARRTDGAELRL